MSEAPTLNIVDEGEGIPFVFQHGLLGDAAQPAEVFPEGPFRRITLECRGHGRSALGDPQLISIATFAEDVAATIAAKAIAPVVLGGISMGAAIALRLAVTKPGLVRALVLARPAWRTEAGPPNMRPYAEVGELLARHSQEEARARFEKSATAARLERNAPDNLASLRGFFSRDPQDETAALLQRIAADGPGVSEAEIAALRLPVLVIGHGRDEAHPLGHARWLAERIPTARLVEITPKAESRARYVAEFRAALSDFLTGIPHVAGSR